MAGAAVACGTLALLGFAGRGIAGAAGGGGAVPVSGGVEPNKEEPSVPTGNERTEEEEGRTQVTKAEHLVRGSEKLAPSEHGKSGLPSGRHPGLGKAEGVTSGGVVTGPDQTPEFGPVHTASTNVLRHGRELFLSSCAACHGLDAQGKFGTAPTLHGVGELAADFYLKTGRMPLSYPRQQPTEEEPAFGPRDIHALVSYIGTFGGPPVPKVNPAKGSVVRGQEVFSLDCAGCHTIQGQGGIVIGSWVPSLNRFIPKKEKYNLIGEALRIGPYLMPRFGEKEISEYDVNSIAAYVKTLQHPEDRGGWGIGRIGPIPEGIVTWFMAILALLLIARLLGERAPARRRIE